MRRWEADAQGTRDAATLLPVAAAFLFLPPFLFVFIAPARVAGIPLVLIYVFGVWAAIVFSAWLLARRHARMAEGASDAADAAGQRLPGQH
ncbi:hypothetical protein ASD44_04310 [Mesorhizobium sp. Root554]|uniref:hypothetical protein n=1 Tax=unclassified Mesorhizobium TaxID=325217 RepID=UPI0006F7E819|nr:MULTISPECIES: hypothetical protein [unclassified Mesorhizobium]KQZ13384.1 hypothetical protein ASD27_04315 [Mesorhizobium sp. Root1471]KQZ35897.1 hypothetical protein ASD44_04310 [Mesorhizobium sp. Root554]